jgi:hypothetical protein
MPELYRAKEKAMKSFTSTDVRTFLEPRRTPRADWCVPEGETRSNCSSWFIALVWTGLLTFAAMEIIGINTSLRWLAAQLFG